MMDMLQALYLKRYPRLIRAIKWQGVLSTTEACGVVLAHRNGQEWPCEAVSHYGGTTTLLQDAIRNRHIVPTY